MDKRTLIFTSTFENDKAFHANVYRYLIDQARLDRLADEKWNEHATYSPSGKRIVWMSGRDNLNGGTDYWSMNPTEATSCGSRISTTRPSDLQEQVDRRGRRQLQSGRQVPDCIPAGESGDPGGRHGLIELEDDWERRR